MFLTDFSPDSDEGIALSVLGLKQDHSTVDYMVFLVMKGQYGLGING